MGMNSSRTTTVITSVLAKMRRDGLLDGATEALAGKTVFVGATALELGDTVAVPVHRALSGVVMQATAYATLHGIGVLSAEEIFATMS
jgi:CHASE2 domain-containing sensor protein